MYYDSTECYAFCAGITVIFLGIANLVLFEFSPFAYILLAALTIAAVVIGIFVNIRGKINDEEKKKRVNYAIIGCSIAFCLLLLTMFVIGTNKMQEAIERFSRNTTETVEYNIISMGEDKSFSGNIFCFGTNDYYIVMQETENGGYLKEKYPSGNTVLFETDAEPCVKTIKAYEENVLVAKEGLFLPAKKKPGENIESKQLKDVQYEIYIPKGTLKELPSMDMQFEDME